ncbi:MAG: hypothetical protein JWN25_1756 [Verrucomicrobiales bacterium]|nr:hypothetical protein [Verrucomicrobiales bacterium]MDB6130709.1 hypothetical protein [Verrucomicrobiales bacterium]
MKTIGLNEKRSSLIDSIYEDFSFRFAPAPSLYSDPNEELLLMSLWNMVLNGQRPDDCPYPQRLPITNSADFHFYEKNVRVKTVSLFCSLKQMVHLHDVILSEVYRLKSLYELDESEEDLQSS